MFLITCTVHVHVHEIWDGNNINDININILSFISSTTSDDPQLSDKEDDIGTPTQYPWQLLPGDPHYNENLRTEFYYEESPSTTLCMVILDLLSDAKACAGFILHCCHNVSMQLVADDSGRVNEEIDHYFTIKYVWRFRVLV